MGMTLSFSNGKIPMDYYFFFLGGEETQTNMLVQLF